MNRTDLGGPLDAQGRTGRIAWVSPQETHILSNDRANPAAAPLSPPLDWAAQSDHNQHCHTPQHERFLLVYNEIRPDQNMRAARTTACSAVARVHAHAITAQSRARAERP
jgi:hypothetical protein